MFALHLSFPSFGIANTKERTNLSVIQPSVHFKEKSFQVYRTMIKIITPKTPIQFFKNLATQEIIKTLGTSHLKPFTVTNSFNRTENFHVQSLTTVITYGSA